MYLITELPKKKKTLSDTNRNPGRNVNGAFNDRSSRQKKAEILKS